MTSLSDIQARAVSLQRSHNWPDKVPEIRLAYLISEVGELARDLISLTSLETNCQREDSQAITTADEIETLKCHFADEIYDVIWNACDLARITGVDLEAAIARVDQRNQSRSWR